MANLAPLVPLLLATLFYFSSAAVLNNTEKQNWHPVSQYDSDAEYTHAIWEEELSDRSKTPTGLLALGGRSKQKTVLLQDGEASDTISFSLVLKTGEALKKVVHVVNDSAIITETRKQVRQIGGAPIPSYNITLTHQFEGNVGIATFLLQVTTTRTKYITVGTYYAAGISIRIPGVDSMKGIVSGMNSPGLSFQNPEVVSLNSRVGQLPLSIDYQPVGPDVINVPPTLYDVLRTARISIKNSDASESVPLLEYTLAECGPLQTAEINTADNLYIFQDGKCDVGFDESSNLLVLNLNRERSGSAVVEVSFPTINIDGEGYETSINLFVGKAMSVKPVVAVDSEFELVLDHFGLEEFKLPMYNTMEPDQKSNASSYLMDLPGNRYATIDFESSKMENPIQEIAFKTLRPGTEDPAVWRLIQKALNALEPEVSPENEMDLEVKPSPGSEVPVRTRPIKHVTDLEMNPNSRLNLSTLYHSDGSFSHFLSDEDSFFNLETVKTMKENSSYQSRVHVQFPQNDFLTTAVINGQNLIRTSFASETLAVVKSSENSNKESVQVTLGLAGYTTANFSEHKNQQIGSFLKNNALNAANGTTGDVNLVKLETVDMSLVTSYDMKVSGNSTEIAAALLKDETLLARLAEEAHMDISQITDFSARSSMVGENPSNVNGGDEATILSGITTSALVVAIVILVVILTIPLFVFCFGYIISRRRREGNEASDLNSADTTAAAIDANSAIADPSIASPAMSQGIVKDKYGRADDGENESFKMQRELFRDGYFGDNNPRPSTGQDSEN